MIGEYLRHVVFNADVGRSHDIVDGERPHSLTDLTTSAAPLTHEDRLIRFGQSISRLDIDGIGKLIMGTEYNLPTSDEPSRATAHLHAIFSALVSASWPPFAKWRRSLRDQHNHFGSLDDQTLADIGLQRSAMRAAEYGVMPSHQVLAVACDQNAANDRGSS